MIRIAKRFIIYVHERWITLRSGNIVESFTAVGFRRNLVALLIAKGNFVMKMGPAF